jgi:hypothetical protein
VAEFRDHPCKSAYLLALCLTESNRSTCEYKDNQVEWIHLNRNVCHGVPILFIESVTLACLNWCTCCTRRLHKAVGWRVCYLTKFCRLMVFVDFRVVRWSVLFALFPRLLSTCARGLSRVGAFTSHAESTSSLSNTISLLTAPAGTVNLPPYCTSWYSEVGDCIRC